MQEILNPVISPELALMLKDGSLNDDEITQAIEDEIEQTAFMSWQDQQACHEEVVDETEVMRTNMPSIDDLFEPNDGMSKIEKRMRRRGYRKLDDELPREQELCIEIWSVQHKRPVRVNIKRTMFTDCIVDFRKGV